MDRSKSKPEISPVMHGLATYISRALKKSLPKPVQEKPKKNEVDDQKAKQKKKLGQQLKQLEDKIDVLKKKKAAGEEKLSLPSVYGDQKLFSETLAEFNAVNELAVRVAQLQTLAAALERPAKLPSNGHWIEFLEEFFVLADDSEAVRGDG